MKIVTSLVGGLAGAAVFVLALWAITLPAAVRYADAHPGLAGWVQAISAVLAFGGLFLAQHLDHRNTARIRIEDADERRKHAARASITAAKFLTAAIRGIENMQAEAASDGWHSGRIAMVKADLSAAISANREFDRGSLPSEEAVVAWVNLLQAGHVTDALLAHQEEKAVRGDPIEPAPFASVREGAEGSLAKLTSAWAASGLTSL